MRRETQRGNVILSEAKDLDFSLPADMSDDICDFLGGGRGEKRLDKPTKLCYMCSLDADTWTEFRSGTGQHRPK